MFDRTAQQARINIAALALLALLAFSSFAAGRLTAVPQQVFLTSPTAVTTRTLAQRPLVSTDSCASGTAYVTGDMAGDASPAAVYAQLCPSK